MNEREELIRDIPLLARLPQEDVRALASRGRVRSYPSGAVIFQEGDPGDSLYIVIEVSVRIVVNSATGEEATVAPLGPAGCAVHPALPHAQPRSAGARAPGGGARGRWCSCGPGYRILTIRRR